MAWAALRNTRGYYANLTMQPESYAAFPSASQMKELDQGSAENGFLLRVGDGGLQDWVYAIGPNQRYIGSVDYLGRSNLGHQMPDAFGRKNHGIDHELLVKIITGLFLVHALGVGSNVARHFGASQVRWKVATAVRPADFQARKLVERTVKNEMREEDGCFEWISDNVAEIARSL